MLSTTSSIQWTYVGSVFIGMLIALYYIKFNMHMPKYESFTTATTGASTTVTAHVEDGIYPATASNPLPASISAEKIGIQELFAYLTTFSDYYPKNTTDEIYNRDSGWVNIADTTHTPRNKFTISAKDGAVAPTSVRKQDPSVTDSVVNMGAGFNLKGFALRGPLSRELGNVTTNDYELPSFSVCLYGDIKSIQFNDITTEKPVVFFELFVETPNKVRFQMRPYDASNVLVEALMGNLNTFYQWKVPVASLLSNGSLKMLTFVYNKEDSSIGNNNASIQFYVGNTKYPASFSNVDLKIYLANSYMIINRNQNFDMNMYAFALFKSKALSPTEVQLIHTYFNTEASNINAQLQSQQDKSNALITQQQKELDKYTEDMDQCRNQLSECKMSLEELEKYREQKKRWQIQFKGKTLVSNDDLRSCGPLHINAFGKSNGAPLYSTSAALEEKIKKLRDKFKIPYPIGVSSSTSSTPPTNNASGQSPPPAGTPTTPPGTITNSNDLTNASLNILPKPVCSFFPKPVPYTESNDGMQLYDCLKNNKIWNANKCVDSIKFGVDSSDFATRCAYSCGNNYTKNGSRICDLDPKNM